MAKMKIYEFARSLQERYPDIKGKDLVKLLTKLSSAAPMGVFLSIRQSVMHCTNVSQKR